MRDPNMRMLMENLCKDSPMFDFVEQTAGRTVKSSAAAGEMNKEDEKENLHAKSDQLKNDQKAALYEYMSQLESDFPEENPDLVRSYENKSFRELMTIRLDAVDI